MQLATTTARRPTFTAEDASRGPRLLVIDDEEPIRFATKDYFESYGLAVDSARELEEAQALLAHVTYAVVIADLRLTGTYGAEGLALVDYVRERCSGTRIILFTAYGSREVEAEARRLGVDCFLQKPTPLPDVAQIVFGLLETRA